jgi:hypothetical protein
MVKRQTTTGTSITLKKSFNISFILHLLPFLLLLGAMPNCIGCGHGGGGGSAQEEEKKQSKNPANPGDPDTRQIKDKDPVEVAIVNTPVQKGEEQLAYEAAQKRHEECKPFFGGIGISYGPFDGTIQKVYKYYPAWSAGIKEGDKIINLGEIRGEVGTEVTVIYSRNGSITQLKMKRGRICVEDALKEALPKEIVP